MPHHGARDGADVVCGDEQASVDDGAGFRPDDQILARARTCADVDVFLDEVRRAHIAGARRAHEADGVFHHMIAHRQIAHGALQVDDRARIEDLRERVFLRGGRDLRDDLLLGLRGIIDIDAEHEAVELRLGKRVGAFLFERVLRREHEERRLERERVAGGGDAVFLHGLEQRGLRLRRSAVDLIGEQHLGKDRPLDEAVFLFPAVLVHLQDVGAGDVRRHEIGGELDALELEIEHLGDGAHEHRLREAGHADEQHMAARDDRGEHVLHDLLLPDDGLADLLEDALGVPSHLLDQCLKFGSVRDFHLLARSTRARRLGEHTGIRAVFLECEHRIADHDLVAALEHLILDALAIEDRAIERAHVLEPPRAILRIDARVLARSRRVGRERDVALRVAPDDDGGAFDGENRAGLRTGENADERHGLEVVACYLAGGRTILPRSFTVSMTRRLPMSGRCR